MMLITIQDAFGAWEAEIKPAVMTQYGEHDNDALHQSWCDYTDALCKDGQLTALQYTYCPTYDESMPDDDFGYICDQLGLSLDKIEQLREMADL